MIKKVRARWCYIYSSVSVSHFIIERFRVKISMADLTCFTIMHCKDEFLLRQVLKIILHNNLNHHDSRLGSLAVSYTNDK